MIDDLSVEFHIFSRCIKISFSVDEMLLPRYVKWSTNFRVLLLRVEMVPFLSVYNAYNLFCVHVEDNIPAACYRICSRGSS